MYICVCVCMWDGGSGWQKFIVDISAFLGFVMVGVGGKIYILIFPEILEQCIFGTLGK